MNKTQVFGLVFIVLIMFASISFGCFLNSDKTQLDEYIQCYNQMKRNSDTNQELAVKRDFCKELVNNTVEK